jgi:hypothetical protein
VIPDGSVVLTTLRLAGVETQIEVTQTVEQALRDLQPADPAAS